jgi:uncharacterized membrane protein YoaK (UPF0700 family)
MQKEYVGCGTKNRHQADHTPSLTKEKTLVIASFTHTSMGPNSVSTRSADASIPSASATSHWMIIALPPGASKSHFAPSNPSRPRAMSPMCAPSVLANLDSATAESLAKAREKRAIALALIAGYLDAFGYLTLGTYVSFMSGNTTQAGCKLAGENFGESVFLLLAVISFVTGVFAGTLLSHCRAFQYRRLRVGLISGSLILIMAFAVSGFLNRGFGVVTLSMALEIMNTLLSQLDGEPVNITFITGTLTKVGRHLAMAVRKLPLSDARGSWDTHLHRALILGSERP